MAIVWQYSIIELRKQSLITAYSNTLRRTKINCKKQDGEWRSLPTMHRVSTNHASFKASCIFDMKSALYTDNTLLNQLYTNLLSNFSFTSAKSAVVVKILSSSLFIWAVKSKMAAWYIYIYCFCFFVNIPQVLPCIRVLSLILTRDMNICSV